jgi:hypothetical protein
MIPIKKISKQHSTQINYKTNFPYDASRMK